LQLHLQLKKDAHKLLMKLGREGNRAQYCTKWDIPGPHCPVKDD
jgi:hypothetical protein